MTSGKYGVKTDMKMEDLYETVPLKSQNFLSHHNGLYAHTFVAYFLIEKETQQINLRVVDKSYSILKKILNRSILWLLHTQFPKFPSLRGAQMSVVDSQWAQVTFVSKSIRMDSITNKKPKISEMGWFLFLFIAFISWV